MSSRPLHIRLAHRIRADYLPVGTKADGKRLPTERELEEKYHVSRPTIAKALSLLVAEGLIYRRQGSGTYTRPQIPSLMSDEKRLIGIVAPTSNATVILDLFDGVERTALQAGYRVLLSSSGQNYEREKQVVGELIQDGASAIVLYPMSRTVQQLADDYLLTEWLDFPIVLVDIATPSQGRNQVVFDNYRLGYDMTMHLLNQGHRDIAMMTPVDDYYHVSTMERIRGHEKAYMKVGVPIHREWPYRIHHWGEENDAFPAFSKWVKAWEKGGRKITAFIAYEDDTAIEVIMACQQLGIRVPEDLTVVGFDNSPFARHFQPAFTSSSPDFVRMGEIAAELVLGQCQYQNGQNEGVMISPSGGEELSYIHGIRAANQTARTYILSVNLKHIRSSYRDIPLSDLPARGALSGRGTAIAGTEEMRAMIE